MIRHFSREFIRSSGTACASLALLPVTREFLNFPIQTKKQNYIPVSSHPNEADLIEPWSSIVDIARRTPSPHNTQPWKLRIHNQEKAQLFLDHSRALPAEDLTGCFIICSLGMFVEACRLIAANFGISLSFKRNLEIQSSNRYSSLGWFEISKSKASISEFSNELFVNRRTSRLHLSPELVTPTLLTKLKSRSSEARHQLAYISDPKLIKKILDLNLHAVVEDMQDHSYHGEITQWFRYDDQEALNKKDGLSASCMLLSKREFRFFANNPELATFPVLGPILRSQYRSSLGGAPQLAILCGDFFQHELSFEVGRMFIQLWLDMANNNLYLHPFGNLVTNMTARKKLIELTGVVNPWIVFRFGYSEIPPLSYRLDTSSLII